MPDNVKLFRQIVERGLDQGDLSVADESCASDFAELAAEGDKVWARMVARGTDAPSRTRGLQRRHGCLPSLDSL